MIILVARPLQNWKLTLPVADGTSTLFESISSQKRKKKKRITGRLGKPMMERPINQLPIGQQNS